MSSFKVDYKYDNVVNETFVYNESFDECYDIVLLFFSTAVPLNMKKKSNLRFIILPNDKHLTKGFNNL